MMSYRVSLEGRMAVGMILNVYIKLIKVQFKGTSISGGGKVAVKSSLIL